MIICFDCYGLKARKLKIKNQTHKIGFSKLLNQTNLYNYQNWIGLIAFDFDWYK